MTQQTNPAKRLHEMLDQVVRIGDRQFEYEPDIPDELAPIWAYARGIPEDRFPDSLTDLLHLVESISQFLQQHDVKNKESHLERISKVRALTFMMGSMSWTQFRQQFTDDFLELLKWIDSDISDPWDVTPWSDDDLEFFQTEIEALINDVLESELGDEIKRVIIDGLEVVRQSVMQYRVLGLEGLRGALDRNIGIIARYGRDLEKANQKDDRQIVSRWWSVLEKLDMVVSAGFNVQQLAQPAITQLMLNSVG